MKKRTIAVALLLAAAVGLLSGCSSEEEIFYSPGYWRDDTYYSAFLGLRFTLPEGWEAADEDTLSQMSTDADRILDMQRGGDGENPDSVYHYELSATDPETGAGILALVQETSTNADTYLEGLQSGAEMEGATYTTGDVLHLELAGRRYLVLPLTMEGETAPYQRQYARKYGDYLILIMLFTPDEETIPFSTLEGYLSSLSES